MGSDVAHMPTGAASRRFRGRDIKSCNEIGECAPLENQPDDRLFSIGFGASSARFHATIVRRARER
jgi:hypothetical protein